MAQFQDFRRSDFSAKVPDVSLLGPTWLDLCHKLTTAIPWPIGHGRQQYDKPGLETREMSTVLWRQVCDMTTSNYCKALFFGGLIFGYFAENENSAKIKPAKIKIDKSRFRSRTNKLQNILAKKRKRNKSTSVWKRENYSRANTNFSKSAKKVSKRSKWPIQK